MERQVNDLDSTIGALQGGLTSIAPSTAVSTIEGWQTQLQAADKPELQQIAAGLGELKQQLTSGNLDGRTIGQLMQRLGDQTTAAAATADSAVQSKLEQLGALLSRAGGALS